MVTERFSLKDALFNEPKVRQLANEIAAVHPAFPMDKFITESVSRFPELGLKARIAWLTECLKANLPGGFRESLEIILAALPPELDPDRTDDDFGDFIHAPYGDFVARFGLSKVELETSLSAIHRITRRFSCEGAIRPFLNTFPDETLAVLNKWAEDPNYHVRRLCSEGTRPLLPWNMRLTIPYQAPMPILDRLHADSTRYVTRSVANHLNDVAKIDPDLVIARLNSWQLGGAQSPSEISYLTKHALRTLIKRGHPDALRLIGIELDAPVSLNGFSVSDEVGIGESVEFSFVLSSPADCVALVDFVLHFAGPNGKPGGRKVFKLRRFALSGGVPLPITKRHPMRGGMTTRSLYPGKHRLEIQVNGQIAASGTFMLRQR